MELEEARQWIQEGLVRLRTELECALEHMDMGEYPQIVVHCHTLEMGVRSVGSATFEYLLSLRERAEVLKTVQETQTGQPMKIEEFKDGFMIVPERVDVPDDASGLDD